MLYNTTNPFSELKQKAVQNQHYEMAAYIRDIERDIIRNLKYGDKIPSEYFKKLNDILKGVGGYNFYKPWLRKIKINTIYARENSVR
jgi:hypothetical protein